VYSQRLLSVTKGLLKARIQNLMNATDNMTVIWALGLMRLPDSLRPLYLPQYLEGSPHVTYGYTTLRVSDSVHKCLGPLEVENKEDDRPLIVADGKSPLVVGAENVMHYPSHLTILPAIKFQTPSQDLILAWRLAYSQNPNTSAPH